MADLDKNPATRCSLCPPGTYQPGYQTPTDCALCPVNTFDHDHDPITPCAPCSSGFSSLAGATQCEPNPCATSMVFRSDTVCRGYTADHCSYVCPAGYSPEGRHVCQANGTFAGGRCAPDVCLGGVTIPHSSTDCSGRRTDEACEFSCERGFHSVGVHRCMYWGYLYGGE